ncbi:MAG TPA: non-heme iron oxygenase ferredoxin subunit [Sphingopyxis sp.]|nr:non-heme iron oxygenase ferredoxin subunit [Sphingopyxis sp.]HMP44539.1 non-heme iron oxygenase ferredoxin subunit [Sphingopyxis sp.]
MSDAGHLHLCAAADVAEGMIRRVSAQGYEPLAVCRIDGRVHLFADTCSHGMASLSEGEIEEGQIFCPFHGGAFDVVTGMPTERPCTLPIAVYQAIERDGDLYVAARG